MLQTLESKLHQRGTPRRNQMEPCLGAGLELDNFNVVSGEKSERKNLFHYLGAGE